MNISTNFRRTPKGDALELAGVGAQDNSFKSKEQAIRDAFEAKNTRTPGALVALKVIWRSGAQQYLAKEGQVRPGNTPALGRNAPILLQSMIWGQLRAKGPVIHLLQIYALTKSTNSGPLDGRGNRPKPRFKNGPAPGSTCLLQTRFRQRRKPGEPARRLRQKVAEMKRPNANLIARRRQHYAVLAALPLLLAAAPACAAGATMQASIAFASPVAVQTSAAPATVSISPLTSASYAVPTSSSATIAAASSQAASIAVGNLTADSGASITSLNCSLNGSASGPCTSTALVPAGKTSTIECETTVASDGTQPNHTVARPSFELAILYN